MSNTERLQTLSEEIESQQQVLSPEVGWYSSPPEPGTYLGRGAFAGKLTILNTVYNLYLPHDIHGRVTEVKGEDYVIPVEYRQELFSLDSSGTVLNESTADGTGPDTSQDTDDREETGFIVTAFTTGIFYAKPSPDAPPFVSAGDKIEKGKALGLIEVMKTFNHIIFQGTPESTGGTVKKIFVKDSQEVKQGERLFLII